MAGGATVAAMLSSISGGVCGFALAGQFTLGAAAFVFALAGFIAGFAGRGLLVRGGAPEA